MTRHEFINEDITKSAIDNASVVVINFVLQFLKIEAKEMQFLYDDGDSHIFMDNISYEQINVINSLVGKSKNFLKAGMNVDLLFDDNEVLVLAILFESVVLI